jgi:5-formyltetrahydrofolate cyclo-ligase
MKKELLREFYSNKRRELSPGQLQQLSEQICALFFTHFPVEHKTISLFLPIERQREINTYQIWEKALSFDAKVAVPKANFETNELKHLLFESEDQLELSQWGIPEPKKGKIIAADRFDYVLVPLLAVDQKGNRVGYGKGFYDRFLKKCAPACRFIGLSLFDPIDSIVDVLPSDVKLHACITPEKVHWFDK